MALSGPRLDRPSAIGDEGRGRTASLWIASAVVLAIGVAGGMAIGDPALVPSLGTLVGVTIAGVGLMNRDRFRPLFVGHLLFVVFGSLLVLSMAVVVLVESYGLATLGIAIAMVGLGLSWANVGAFEGFRNVLLGVAITYAAMLFTLALFVALVVVLLAGGVLVEVTTAGQSPVASLTWLLVTVGYAAASLRVLLWQFPYEQLVAYDRREPLRERTRTVGWVLAGVALSAVPTTVTVWVVAIAGGFETLAAVAPPVVAAFDAAASPLVLGTVGGVGTASLLVVVVITSLRLATRHFDTTTARWVAAVTAGGLVGVLVVMAFGGILVIPSINRLIFALTVLFAVNVGPLTLLVLTPMGLMAVAVGLIPDRAGGPALAAAGLLVATVGFGGASPPVVFACAAGTVVVWDVSAYGLGLTAELGHLPETRRLELFHGVVVVGIGLVAVLVLTGLEFVRSTVFAGVGSTWALFLAGIGVLLLLAPLRG